MLPAFLNTAGDNLGGERKLDSVYLVSVLASNILRIECVLEAVTKEIEAHGYDQDQDARDHGKERGRVDNLLGIVEHITP